MKFRWSVMILDYITIKFSIKNSPSIIFNNTSIEQQTWEKNYYNKNKRYRMKKYKLSTI